MYIYGKVLKKRHKEEQYYNRTAKTKEEEFQKGESVLIWDNKQRVWKDATVLKKLSQPRSRVWKDATVLKKLSQPRSYLIKTTDGHIIRRNIKYLKKFKGTIKPALCGLDKYDSPENMQPTMDEASTNKDDDSESTQPKSNITTKINTRKARNPKVTLQQK
ncbi:hypothetical protein QE152_g36279 [Popillia japonica]|uniref:Uncharacterized protein n=1 Tax=Popillia japonica TaxID=7064 RepID=A0AAW1IDN6_POPJA